MRQAAHSHTLLILMSGILSGIGIVQSKAMDGVAPQHCNHLPLVVGDSVMTGWISPHPWIPAVAGLVVQDMEEVGEI